MNTTFAEPSRTIFHAFAESEGQPGNVLACVCGQTFTGDSPWAAREAARAHFAEQDQAARAPRTIPVIEEAPVSPAEAAEIASLGARFDELCLASPDPVRLALRCSEAAREAASYGPLALARAHVKAAVRLRT